MKIRDFLEGFTCLKCGKRVDEGHAGWVVTEEEGCVKIPLFIRCDCGQLHRVRATRVAIDLAKG